VAILNTTIISILNTALIYSGILTLVGIAVNYFGIFITLAL
jgi:hypothetical protein